jgi:glycosyltransferase involved in cell wall biosynthesis
MNTFEVKDRRYSTRTYRNAGKQIDFVNYEAHNVPASIAYRMSRIVNPGQDDFIISPEIVPFNIDSWKKDRRLIWSCNLASANGYGAVAENVIANMIRLGVNVQNPGSVAGSAIAGGEYVDKDAEKSLNQSIEPDCIEIQHCQPPAIKTTIVQRIWNYTMYETTHTPRSWIKMINQTEHVVVPSSWLVESWREQGLKVPISVFGHGVDPRFYYYVERPQHDVFTFLHYGQLSVRKGTDLVYRAFLDEFRKQNDVKLILKNSMPIYPVPLYTDKVEYINAIYSKKRMLELLTSADCAVFPCRGEGFSLAPLECMATGLPTIVTNWSGPADYTTPQDTLQLEYKMARSDDFDSIYHSFYEADENSGEWAEPSYDNLRWQMRWAYEHRDKAKEMGKRASKRIAKDWTWEKKVKDFLQVVDEFA